MSRVCLFVYEEITANCSLKTPSHNTTYYKVDNKMQIANISFRPKQANGETELFAPSVAAVAHYPRVTPHKRSLALARHR